MLVLNLNLFNGRSYVIESASNLKSGWDEIVKCVAIPHDESSCGPSVTEKMFDDKMMQNIAWYVQLIWRFCFCLKFSQICICISKTFFNIGSLPQYGGITT